MYLEYRDTLYNEDFKRKIIFYSEYLPSMNVS